MSRGRKPWIIDEYTNRTDLTHVQKWNLRHPEKRKQHKNNNQRKNWSDWPEWKRIEKNSRKYGLLYSDLEKLFQGQNFKCKLCDVDVTLSIARNDTTRGVIDHCHNTNRIRGILCHNCNKALGLVKEKTDTLRKMIRYLG